MTSRVSPKRIPEFVACRQYLRRIGAKLDFDAKDCIAYSYYPGIETTKQLGTKGYEHKVHGPICLVIQLWKEGECRVCHSVKGCSNTIPTSFYDLIQMQKAIAFELGRALLPQLNIDIAYGMDGKDTIRF